MDYIKSRYNLIKEALIDDRFNFYVLTITFLVFAVEYIIWQKLIVKPNVFVYSVLNYFPLELFAAIFVIHLILAVYSYSEETKISNLLLGFNLFYLYLILITEIFYISN